MRSHAYSSWRTLVQRCPLLCWLTREPSHCCRSFFSHDFSAEMKDVHSVKFLIQQCKTSMICLFCLFPHSLAILSAMRFVPGQWKALQSECKKGSQAWFSVALHSCSHIVFVQPLYSLVEWKTTTSFWTRFPVQVYTVPKKTWHPPAKTQLTHTSWGSYQWLDALHILHGAGVGEVWTERLFLSEPDNLWFARLHHFGEHFKFDTSGPSSLQLDLFHFKSMEQSSVCCS